MHSPCMFGCQPIGSLAFAQLSKNRTAEFDRKRDHETVLARAWGYEVEQQAQRDGAGIANATVVEGVAYFLLAVDLRPGVEDIPSLVISIRAPWLELPVAEFVNTMQTIYQGVLDGIFCQRPTAAWFSAQCKRILPSSSSLGLAIFFLVDAAWVRSRAERPSVSYTKVTSKNAWTSHNLQVTN